MQKYTIEIEGVQLDTFEDFGISLNYQIEEVFDITKRLTNYSKTIEIPGTPKNNKFFKQIFDVNIDTLFYNPSTSAKPAVVRIGDNSIFTGNLQLLNILDNQGEIVYEIALLGTLRTILTDIADYDLTSLDLSKWNHTRTKETVNESWFYNVYENGTLVDYNQGGIGYVYPHIMNNFDSNSAANVILLENQFPAVYVKTIMDSLFEFAGYSYTSNFLNGDYFRKLILPFTGDKIELSDVDIDNRTTIVGVDGSGPEYAGATGGGIGTGYQSFTSGMLYPGNGWYNNNAWSYYMPLSRESGTVGDIDFQDFNGQFDEYGGWICQDAGYYNFDMDLKVFAKYFSASGSFFRYNGSNTWKYFYRVRKVNIGGSTTVLYTSTFPFEVAPSDDDNHNSPWYDIANELTMGASISNIYMQVGEKFVIEVGINYTLGTSEWDVQSSPDDVYMRLVAKESSGGIPSYIKIEPSSNQSFGNEEVILSNTLPSIKMKDFFLNIIKMFNLVVVDNPNKPNDLIIEPREDYYNSKRKVRDWNGIIDNSSEVKISPMAEVDSRTYIFSYKEDNDFYNAEYTDETKEVYGSLRLDIENDFSYEEKKLELIFSPTPDASQFIQPRVAPYFASMVAVGEFKAKKVKPRILFYGGPTLVNYFADSSLSYAETRLYLKDYESQPLASAINSATYPYCGMWDNPYNPVYDLGFGRTRKIYWDTTVVPYNNLYEMFHRNTIENIIDINSKLLEASFHLTPRIMAEFDFRDIIFLRGQYWRVMKVKDYNPAGSDKLTKVILYKLVDYQTYNSNAEELPETSKPCPIDMIAVRQKTGWWYVSASGQHISEDCCKSTGGVWVNGGCKVKKPIGPTLGDGPLNPVGPVGPVGPTKPIKFPYGGNNILPTSDPVGPSIFTSGGNTINSPTAKITGRSNYISRFTDNVTVIGDNNTVNDGVEGTIIIGDNINATESNSIYLENVRIDSDGNIFKTGLSVIDAGENIVFPYSKTNEVDAIDGTIDSVRNPNGDVKNRVVIDGTNNSDEPI